jgi:hypothetical protein
VLQHTPVRTSTCVTPRARRVLSAMCWCRNIGEPMAALELALEIARQVAHLQALGRSARPVIEHYREHFSGLLRTEHVALAEAVPEFGFDADLPNDVARKLRYVARVANRTLADTVEWSADLAASTMCDRRAAAALQLTVAPPR